MAKDDKLKALDAAIAQIERQYGKGSVMKLGDNSANMSPLTRIRHKRRMTAMMIHVTTTDS